MPSARGKAALLAAALLGSAASAAAQPPPSPAPTVIDVPSRTKVRVTLDGRTRAVLTTDVLIRFVTFEGTAYVPVKHIPAGEPFWVEVLYAAPPAPAPQTVELEWSGQKMRADVAAVTGQPLLFRSTRAFYTLDRR